MFKYRTAEDLNRQIVAGVPAACFQFKGTENNHLIVTLLTVLKELELLSCEEIASVSQTSMVILELGKGIRVFPRKALGRSRDKWPLGIGGSTIARACGAFWSPRVPWRACDVTPRDPPPPPELSGVQCPTPIHACLAGSQVEKRMALTPFSYITSVGCTVCIVPRPLDAAPGKLLGLAVRLGHGSPGPTVVFSTKQELRLSALQDATLNQTLLSLPSFSSSFLLGAFFFSHTRHIFFLTVWWKCKY